MRLGGNIMLMLGATLHQRMFAKGREANKGPDEHTPTTAAFYSRTKELAEKLQHLRLHLSNSGSDGPQSRGERLEATPPNRSQRESAAGLRLATNLLCAHRCRRANCSETKLGAPGWGSVSAY